MIKQCILAFSSVPLHRQLGMGGDLVQVLGDGVGALTTKIFLPSPQMQIWGDGGGLTVSWN